MKGSQAQDYNAGHATKSTEYIFFVYYIVHILVAQMVKNMPAMQETWVQFLGPEDPLEKGMATHSGILACGIPQTKESMGSQRVRHN